MRMVADCVGTCDTSNGDDDGTDGDVDVFSRHRVIHGTEY